MKIKNLIIVAALSAIAFTSCEDNKKKEQEEKDKIEMERVEAEREAEMKANEAKMEMESNSIAAKAMATAELSTLVSALQSAELATMMKEDEGPYTVFAPTNDAFAKVPKATLDKLMTEEGKGDLKDVLQYHVVKDKITAEDLKNKIKENDGSYKFSTVGGGELTAMMSGENVVLKDGNGKTATIVKADIEASNGVVHEIDAVVMKKS
ncbi:fasciclin domain-containing protein [Gillisia sp. M10.2A]|uniref:Fasciclin domain-containing protein n=1 Tax=Gillisia lutea TaxID=2909668 RepID=A0ABS9EHT5_9FLAO|nr:fasciclin domain-containing protein [Gillisia lutea]MCF4102430.1 fasciclin domain-containing protein [Gillisia lutea]